MRSAAAAARSGTLPPAGPEPAGCASVAWKSESTPAVRAFALIFGSDLSNFASWPSGSTRT